MKKIVSTILLIAMALSLFACGAKPQLVKITDGKLLEVNCTLKAGTKLDKIAFAKAYNSSEVIGTFDANEDKTNEVIAAVYTTGEAFTLYYLGNAKFGVTGTLVTESYTIKATDLEKLYNEAVHPAVKHVKADEATASKVTFVAKADASGDAAAFAKAYNNAEIIGAVTNEKKSNDVIVLQFEDGKTVFSFTRVEEAKFIVEGSLVEIAYVIKSTELEKLYNEAVK